LLKKNKKKEKGKTNNKQQTTKKWWNGRVVQGGRLKICWYYTAWVRTPLPSNYFFLFFYFFIYFFALKTMLKNKSKLRIVRVLFTNKKK
jgi:hypothetical protein